MDEQKLTCVRCGMVSFVAPDKRKRKDELCSSCRARPAKTISYGLDRPCRPWGGAFDVEDNPLLNGHLAFPGVRVCGHRDCCELTHIV